MAYISDDTIIRQMIEIDGLSIKVHSEIDKLLSLREKHENVLELTVLFNVEVKTMTELLANLQSQIFLIQNRKSDPDFKNNFRDLQVKQWELERSMETNKKLRKFRLNIYGGSSEGESSEGESSED